MKIAIHTDGKPMRNGKPSAKVYPWFDELIIKLKEGGHDIKEVKGFLTWIQMKEILDWCDSWVATDSFWQHFCWYHGKKGFAIFSRSDPNIFGHKENINILKDRKYLRPDQFSNWEACEFIEESFLKPIELIKKIEYELPKL